MGWQYWDGYERRPRRPANGIKAQSQRGAFGRTWWAGRWIAALERLVDSGRLSRGRSYARSGQVLNLDLDAGGIKARVQGSRPSPYAVSIRFTPLTDAAWETVVGLMTAEAIYAAKLLSGEMPAEIERVFEAAGTALFPATSGDLVTDCSCPDWSNPCKHVAAVHYLLGERFDADPFLMFQLRGRTGEQITDALRARRTDGDTASTETEPRTPAEAEAIEPLPVGSPEQFWGSGAAVAPSIRFEAAAMDALPLKRLGPPPFPRGREDFVAVLEGAYRAIAADARRRAAGA